MPALVCCRNASAAAALDGDRFFLEQIIENRPRYATRPDLTVGLLLPVMARAGQAIFDAIWNVAGIAVEVAGLLKHNPLRSSTSTRVFGNIRRPKSNSVNFAYYPK
jgi:hypothetical protein